MEKIFIGLFLVVLFSIPCLASEKINWDEFKVCLQQASDAAVKETDRKLQKEEDQLKLELVKIVQELNDMRFINERP